MRRYGRIQCEQQGDSWAGCIICKGTLIKTDGCPFDGGEFNDIVTPELMHLMSPEKKMVDMEMRRFHENMEENYNMNIPDGETCGVCIAYTGCNGLFGCKTSNTACDWYPVRFIKKVK